MDDVRGRSLKKFGDIEKIGEGTYGIVYRAVHRQSQRFVALKKICLDRDSEGIPSTCIREITLLKELNHRNIVRLYDVIHSGLRLYLVFEFIDRDLKALLDLLPGRRLPVQHVKCTMIQMLNALSYCHTRRVIHRDLKPQNILIDNKGYVKLADFGLARNFSIPSRMYTHEVVTLWYRSPEVLLGSPYYSTALDMWSLGCIFYEMYTGRPLFPGDSEIDQLFKIFNLMGTPTNETWPGVEKLNEFKASFPKWEFSQSRMFEKCSGMNGDGIRILKDMLIYDPEKRLTAKYALGHMFLCENEMKPLPVDILIPKVPVSNANMDRSDSSSGVCTMHSAQSQVIVEHEEVVATTSNVTPFENASVAGVGEVRVEHRPEDEIENIGRPYRNVKGGGGKNRG